MKDLVLPGFAMDCRDWIVVMPDDLGMAQEFDDVPLLAVLSTAVLGPNSFRAATGALSIGLPDASMPTRPVSEGSPARLLLDERPARDANCDSDATSLRYVLPTPDHQLALLAEFSTPDGADDEVVARVESLMASFRWAS